MFIKLMGPDDGDGAGGGPEGVSDLETEKAPTLEEMNARLNSIESENKTLKEERTQLLTTLASVEKLVPQRRGKSKEEEPEEDDDDESEALDPKARKILNKEIKRIEAKYDGINAGVMDRLDFQSFAQAAASSGMTQEEFQAMEQQYQSSRGITITGGDGVQRPITRKDIMHLSLGREVEAQRMKEAPEKNFESLRSKLTVGAGIENPGGHQRPVRGLDLNKLSEAKDNKGRLAILEKALEKQEL